MPAVQETIDRVRSIDLDQYKYGFETTIEMEKSEKGISEDVVRFISAKKNEPAWLLEWRLDAYRRWLTMQEPEWARVSYDKVNYNDIYYYAAPKRPAAMSLDEIDPEILKTYEKLGIPLREVEVLEGIAPGRIDLGVGTSCQDPVLTGAVELVGSAHEVTTADRRLVDVTVVPV